MRQVRSTNVGKITSTESLIKEDSIVFFAYSESFVETEEDLDNVEYVYEWNRSHTLCREVKKKEIPGLYACTRINTY
jgi:hypothetical protein